MLDRPINITFEVYNFGKISAKITYSTDWEYARAKFYSNNHFCFPEHIKWADIRKFLLSRVLIYVEDPIKYLEKTEGKLFTDYISVKVIKENI